MSGLIGDFLSEVTNTIGAYTARQKVIKSLLARHIQAFDSKRSHLCVCLDFMVECWKKRSVKIFKKLLFP